MKKNLFLITSLLARINVVVKRQYSIKRKLIGMLFLVYFLASMYLMCFCIKDRHVS